MAQRIRILDSTSSATLGEQYAAFQRGLNQIGAGEDVAIEFKFAENDYKRLDELVAKFVNEEVAVIVAAGGPVTADKAARAAAGKNIPIVYTSVPDAVARDLGAFENVTGVRGKTSDLDLSRVKLLSRLLPCAREFGVLVNANRPTHKKESEALHQAVNALEGKRKLRLDIDTVCDLDEIAASVKRFAADGLDGLVITADPFFNSIRADLVALAKEHELPAIYQWREFATAGGLMSYGPSIAEAYRQAGIYTGLILNGAAPAELRPVEASRFELVINRKTADSLDIGIPPTLLDEADELIG
jgi:putative tryptophan/tyrosine transport system substrate-binding protein